jgi:hypothetical protein
MELLLGLVELLLGVALLPLAEPLTLISDDTLVTPCVSSASAMARPTSFALAAEPFRVTSPLLASTSISDVPTSWSAWSSVGPRRHSVIRVVMSAEPDVFEARPLVELLVLLVAPVEELLRKRGGNVLHVARCAGPHPSRFGGHFRKRLHADDNGRRPERRRLPARLRRGKLSSRRWTAPPPVGSPGILSGVVRSA